jgi:predicted nucleotidyltransferase
MGRPTAVDGIVSVFVSRLRKRYRVRRLILFGSRAEGRADEWSDYDFVVVSPDFEGVPFLKRLPDLYELWDAPVGIDILCYTPAEFEQLASQATLVRDAAGTGVMVI